MKIYDLKLGIEADSLKEAEEKLLRLQQIAVDYTKRNNARPQAVSNDSEITAGNGVMGILILLGLGWISDKLNTEKIDWKMRKYNWQKEKRRRKREEEKIRKDELIFFNKI